MYSPEELRKEAHLKGLAKSKNAKDCGDLTVVPLGHVSTIVMEMLQAREEWLITEVKKKQDEAWKRAAEEKDGVLKFGDAMLTQAYANVLSLLTNA